MMAVELQTESKVPISKGFTPRPTGLLQRKCACGSHAMAGDECEECAKKKSMLQRKLTIGASNDPLEQEADRVADQVMGMSSHSPVSHSLPFVRRYRKNSTGLMGIAPLSIDRVVANSGRSLEPSLQQDMEFRFGYDFSRVKVHTDNAAEQSAHDVNAQAFTVGSNIVFGAGQFQPKSQAGRRLLAHELTHVVQQDSKDAPLNTIQRKADIEKFPQPVPVDCTKEITPEYSCFDLIADMISFAADARYWDRYIKLCDAGKQEVPCDLDSYKYYLMRKADPQKKYNEKERIRAACCKEHEVPGEPPMAEPAPVPQPAQPQPQAPEDKK